MRNKLYLSTINDWNVFMAKWMPKLCTNHCVWLYATLRVTYIKFQIESAVLTVVTYSHVIVIYNYVTCINLCGLWQKSKNTFVFSRREEKSFDLSSIAFLWLRFEQKIEWGMQITVMVPIRTCIPWWIVLFTVTHCIDSSKEVVVLFKVGRLSVRGRGKRACFVTCLHHSVSRRWDSGKLQMLNWNCYSQVWCLSSL